MDPFLWVVILSTILSAFFSLAAYSLRGFRRAHLGEEFEPEQRQRQLERLEDNLIPLRLTASFCRDICNLFIVVAMAKIMTPPGTALDWDRALAAVGISAAIIAIFGVAIPHAWGTHAGEKIVAAAFPVLMGIRYVLYPVVATMQAFDLPIRRLSGISDDQQDQQEVARQEIIQAATEGAAEGTVEHEEVEMIASVIEFAQRQAAEIMTPRTDLVALPVETPWKEACKAIVDTGHTRVPIYQGDLDNIIGILYAKDLLGHVGEALPADVRGIIRKPFFVPETKPLDDLLREFRGRKVHLAVVLDEYGGTAGVVTIEDVLEEIVGEIADEYDRSEPALMRRISDSAAEVDGRMYIDDLNEAMKLSIPEDADYVTVAGMMFSELGYIPKAGETVEAYGARFTVVAADERKITKVQVEAKGDTKGEREEEA